MVRIVGIVEMVRVVAIVEMVLMVWIVEDDRFPVSVRGFQHFRFPHSTRLSLSQAQFPIPLPSVLDFQHFRLPHSQFPIPMPSVLDFQHFRIPHSAFRIPTLLTSVLCSSCRLKEHSYGISG